MPPLDSFIRENVSRETFEKLKKFETLIKEKNSQINLVSRKDIENLWARHIVDSCLGKFIIEKKLGPGYLKGKKIIDIGSGGGFPAIPLSIMMPQNKFTLVESIGKKCACLASFKESLALPLRIENSRVEQIKIRADLVTSRAVARTATLISYAYQRMGTNSHALFWKGEKLQEELYEAKTHWDFDVDVIQLQDIISIDTIVDSRNWVLIRNITPK